MAEGAKEPIIEVQCLSGAEDTGGVSLLVTMAGCRILVDTGRRDTTLAMPPKASENSDVPDVPDASDIPDVSKVSDDADSSGGSDNSDNSDSSGSSDSSDSSDSSGGSVRSGSFDSSGSSGGSVRSALMGPLDAIVLTHAHPDRLGGLASIHQEMPHVPIYMTAPTRAFAARMWMSPGSDSPEIEMMVGAMQPLSMGQRSLLCDGALALTCYPAGHVMGAAMLYLESAAGSLLLTGDITVTDPKTIPGMMLPSIRPDVVLTEATYGGQLYASRAAEELRLVEQVKAVLAQGGRVLFPTLALGRGQEVLAILAQAMEHQKLPAVPIWVDGLLCQICDDFGRFPDWMAPGLRHRYRRYEHPFFSSAVRPLPPAQVIDALQGPSIVVSSRGVEGPEGLTALVRHLADDPTSAFMVSHYTDEESLPALALQKIKAGQWPVDDLALQCQVLPYRLSTHADTSQIVGAVERLRPSSIVVIQGTAAARAATAQALQRAGAAQVYLPEDNECLALQGSLRDIEAASVPVSQGQRQGLQFDDLPQLGEILAALQRPGRLWTVQDILLAWGDQEGANDPDEQARVGRFLGAKASPLRRDHKRNHLFRLRAEREGPGAHPRPSPAASEHTQPAREGPLDMFHALKTVDTLLSERDGLYKRSAHQEELRIQLSFYFPAVAAREHADAIGLIAERTGWSVALRETPHQAALADAVMAVLPDSIALAKRPSIHQLEEKVVVQPEILPSVAVAQRYADAFFEKTGYSLEWKGLELPTTTSTASASSSLPPGSSVAAAPAPGGEGASQSTVFVPTVPPGPAAERPWEINRAYQTIREAFADCPQPLLKAGQKGNLIEVSFISRQIGSRYLDALAALSQLIGWPIQVKDRADQHKIKALAQTLLAPWGIKKEPGFHPDTEEVRATCSTLPNADEMARLNDVFVHETGFQLRVKAVL